VTARSALIPETLKSTSNTIATLGFLLYSVYTLSGFANDWSLHIFGVKAYLSTVTLVLLPLAWLFSGHALRGLRSAAGLCWVGFLLWMILATPLSVWKGGSVAALANYVPRAYMDFFYTCSFLTSLRRCRQWMFVQIASGAALLLSCFAFGATGDTPDDARFRIPDSLFYANSNDLALALLLGISSFLFLFSRRSRLGRMAGVTGILFSTFYAFRTGSRGCVVAASVLMLLIFLLSQRRGTVAVLAMATLGIALAAEPAITLHRLSLFSSEPSSIAATIEDDASLASGQQREQLLKTSLKYTLRHPVFGVGPDQFATAISQDAERAGEHAQWLGTHNTYTQISSECGIPALVFYAAVIGICLRSNLRLYLRARNHPIYAEIAGLSRCLLAGTVLFAVSAFFFHMAYSACLPTLAGFTMALQFAVAPRGKSLRTFATVTDD